jgi:hypothetical protein
MDMPTGRIYESREAAIAAGVKEDNLRMVNYTIKEIASGPFKGRKYVLNPDGSLGKRIRS